MEKSFLFSFREKLRTATEIVQTHLSLGTVDSFCCCCCCCFCVCVCVCVAGKTNAKRRTVNGVALRGGGRRFAAPPSNRKRRRCCCCCCFCVFFVRLLVARKKQTKDLAMAQVPQTRPRRSPVAARLNGGRRRRHARIKNESRTSRRAFSSSSSSSSSSSAAVETNPDSVKQNPKKKRPMGCEWRRRRRRPIR